ncbi:MAG: sulfite exporter TauE/SafE family protein [Endozoicomonas sp.]
MFDLAAGEVGLVFAAFITSTATAILGAGGGVLLLTLMPGLIPAHAIIPVHAIVQLASNVSRVAFAWRSVRWDMLRRYFLGACIGALAGSQIVLSINAQYVPLILGVTILLITWLPSLSTDRLPGRFLSFGVIHTFLATLAGATGPMSGAFLSREGLKKDSLVTTTATFMATAHGLKVVAFALLGFSLAPYLKLVLWMAAGVILGSWVGTLLRKKLPEFSFTRIFRWVITLLALRLIWIALV